MTQHTSRTVRIAVFLLFAVSGSYAAMGDSLAYWLAGMQMVQSARRLTDVQKAAWMVRLGTVTGITAAQGRESIESYRSNPEAWRALVTRAEEIIEGKIDTIPPPQEE